MYACGIRQVQIDREQAYFVKPETLSNFRARLDEALIQELLAIQAAAAMDATLAPSSTSNRLANCMRSCLRYCMGG